MLVLRVGGDGDALASAPSGALPVTQGAGTAEQLVFKPLWGLSLPVSANKP